MVKEKKSKYPNLVEEKKLWQKGFSLVAGIDEVGRGCERPDAEVLTNNGWKFYTDINLKDKVLSYTNTGFIKWQKIEKVIEKGFEGNLIELKNRGIDIIVTPEHCFTIIRRVFKRDKKDNDRLKLVGYTTRKERKAVTDLLDNDLIPRGGEWKGINKKFFKLPQVDKNEEKLNSERSEESRFCERSEQVLNSERSEESRFCERSEQVLINIKLWVAFLGIFLSEGSTSYYKKKGLYRVVISQKKNTPQYKKIYHLIKELPFRFNECKVGFICLNKQLYVYLRQFGKCYDKFIPKDIKELRPHLLNILINWMILGDGACYTGKNRKKVCVYYTVSEKLKDDFEEILLKAGWTYHTNTEIPKDTYIGRRILKKENKVPCFEIRLRRNNKAQIKSLHKKEVFYQGKVFCLRLPKYHNFYVRRNGAGYFTGNSLAGPVVAAAAMINQISILRLRSGLMVNEVEPSKIKNQKHKLNIKTKELRIFSLGVKDSKKLTPRKREEIYQIISRSPEIEWGIGIVSEKIIDKINILEATKLAMKKAIRDLEKKLLRQKRKKTKRIEFLILDGVNRLDLVIPQKAIIKADEKVFSCAAASILAKVSRDRLMAKYDKKYPQYGFKKHKGYPSPYHLKMLKKYGPCRIHRKTFNPVKISNS